MASTIQQPPTMPEFEPAGGHIVQFYETDDFLIDVLSGFMRQGLRAGDACVVIATQAHRVQLETQLKAGGLDLAAARRRGTYRTLDAAKMLTMFMVEGLPDPRRFRESVGGEIKRAAKGGRSVRAFGEMVALLWLEGNPAAALRLEELWNDLRATISPFSLCCAYPMRAFAGDAYRGTFAAICQQHARVIPDEGYTTLTSPDEQQRAVSRLQQEAQSLPVEIAQRQRTEERLRISEQRYRRLFEASLDGILIVDAATGRISEANPAAVGLLGRAREHVLGQELWQVGLFEDREASGETLRRLQTQSVLHEVSLPPPTTNGSWRDVECVSSQFQVDGHVVVQCQLRDVSERRRLAREAAERANELEVIQAVTDVALACHSLDELLPKLLERVRTVLAVDNVAILLLDATETMLTIHMARGPEEEVAGQVRVPMGAGVAGRIAATRAPVVIEDLRTATVANPFLRERLRSLMGVPLLVEDRIIGVVHAATTNPHHFSAGEVGLLRVIADRIALAIAGAQLHQEAQQARREAVERANQLQATIEAIADGVVVFDQDGRLLQMNATAQHLLGYAAQPAYAIATVIDSHRQVRDVRGKALPADEWPVNRVLRGEVITGAAAVDLLIRATHGRDMQVSVSGAPVRSGTGDMLGAVCVFRDVTEQRRLERRTHEALTALLAMANTLVKPPAESEPVGVESARSTPAAQPAGTVASSLIAQRLAELARNVLGCQRVALLAIEPETRRRVPIAVVGLTGEHEARWWAEYRDHPASSGGAESDPTLLARLEAGEALVLDMTQPPYDERPNLYGITTTLVAPMHASNQIIGLLALDYGGPPHVFTEQEQALALAVAQLAALVIERERLLREREEARANELGAQEAARRMHTFLGIAGHELRTPVTSIKAAVQLTERALRATLQSALPAEAAPPLQRAQGLLVRADQQANRLNRLIEDILDVTRTQTGKIELRPEPSDLAEVVRRAVEGQRPAWPGREIALALPRMPVLLILDPDRIEQVVTNFLTNALKYSAPDRPIAVQLTTTQQAARVAVRDYGPGLSPEMRTGIWEPFHQVDGIRQQSGSGVGLGLGLHICRTLIECHGGLVGIESVVGEGSTFWFELPLAPPTPRVPDDEVLG